MKKIVIIFLFLALIIMANGCNEASDTNVLYFGEDEEWFATYTISKVRSSYFDSLYIQYINDRTASVKEQTTKAKNIGKIEYELTIGNLSIKSSYPQSLKGVGNFHVASETNAELVNTNFPDEITLEISWQDKKENIVLHKQD